MFEIVLRVIALLASLSPLFKYVHGIDLQRAFRNENAPCFVPKYTADVNFTWISSVRRWYYPVMSVLDLYLEGLQASTKRDPAELTEDDLYYNACMTYDTTTSGSDNLYQDVVTGFGGIKTGILKETHDGLRTFNWWSTTPGSSQNATSYVTLTDNLTFIFMTTCRQGRMTWGVVSTVEPISEETNALIKRHALSMGFKRKYFTGLRYDTCPAYSRQR